MSALADNSGKFDSDKLTRFARDLRNHVADEAMLREIHAAMKVMLTSAEVNEHTIRRVLREQFDSGELRSESYQLVTELIDKIILEDQVGEAANEPNIPLKSTMVMQSGDMPQQRTNASVQVGTVLRDRFMLQQQLPGGSMGTVFKALDRRLAETDATNHWVAIKVLSPQLSRNGAALRALQQEAAKTRCLSHPNIVRFIDLDREDELYFLVMEWLEGKSLADILNNSSQRKIDFDMALQIMRQVAAALEHAHQRGIVHADVKPGNIMITPSGDVKLYDFGVARVMQKQRDHVAETSLAELKAITPGYSSMQVIGGEEPMPEDDVYSLACLTYRLLAGYRVFGPRSASEAAEAGMSPQRLDGLSDSQWNALKKALSFARVSRFPSPRHFVDAFMSETAAPRRPVKKSVRKAPTMRAGRPLAETNPHFEVDDDEPRSKVPYLFALFLVIAVLAGWQLNWYDKVQPLIASLMEPQATVQQPAPAAPAPEPVAVEEEPAPMAEEPVVEEPAVDAAVAVEVDEVTEEPVQAEPEPEAVAEPEAPPGPDFSALPEPDFLVALPGLGEAPARINVTMIEDGSPVVVDFVRSVNLDDSLELAFLDRGHSGNDAPWETGQYDISENGKVTFAPGQSRARTTLTMVSDPRREPDMELDLVLHDARYQDVEFATVGLTLQDDDLRKFEDSLAPNTITFAVSQVSVREGESAVQIDVIRHKADSTTMEIEYIVSDVTATRDEDYFDPGSNRITFGPLQRTARILIPLVQDSLIEEDEAFLIELSDGSPQINANIYRRIAVMIRDDDSR